MIGKILGKVETTTIFGLEKRLEKREYNDYTEIRRILG